MAYKSIYVAATGQHVGKTTSTLGLIHSLRESGLNVGYCKPVGQQFVTHDDKRVDKDTALFAQFMGFDIEPELHSPIIIGAGDTVRFLDHPEQVNLSSLLDKAREVLQERHDVVVYEGTGHPGVGAVGNVSNSTVAKRLNAGVILVVPAGIGSTIDKLDLNLAPFIQKNIPIIGVIVNKCMPDKMEKVKYYVSKKLAEKGIPVLGVLPYDEELALPLMGTIRKAVGGDIMYNKDSFDNRVQDIIPGSLIDLQGVKHLRNQLLVVSVRRMDDAFRKIWQIEEQEGIKGSLLSGVLLAGKGSLREEHLNYLKHYRIPVIRSRIDSYEAVVKISRIEVKINTRTPWKVQKAVTLFNNNVDLDPVINKIRSWE